ELRSFAQHLHDRPAAGIRWPRGDLQDALSSGIHAEDPDDPAMQGLLPGYRTAHARDRTRDVDHAVRRSGSTCWSRPAVFAHADHREPRAKPLTRGVTRSVIHKAVRGGPRPALRRIRSESA